MLRRVKTLVNFVLIAAKNKEFAKSFIFRWRNLKKLVGPSIHKYKEELDQKRKFLQHIKSNLKFVKGRLANLGEPDELFPLYALYILTRAIKPKIFVETGVASGTSTAFILQGMIDNHQGKLFSIDLPYANMGILPEGRKPGWIVPKNLRYRWKLILGKSSEKLVPLLKKVKEIDMFLHDSDHSYKNMIFEFRTVWKYLRKGVLLITDDYDCNNAFTDFCSTVNREPVLMRRIGVVKK
jgi:hypothetical protein